MGPTLWEKDEEHQRSEADGMSKGKDVDSGPEPLISIDLCPLHSHHAGQQNVPRKSAAARVCGIQ